MSARDRRKARRTEAQQQPQQATARAAPRAAGGAPLEYRAAKAAPMPLAVDDAARAQTITTWVLVGYLMVIILGFWLLQIDGVTVGKLNKDRAFFQAANAATLTGFRGNISFGTSLAGPAILLMLMLAGAMTSLVVGGMAAVRIVRLPYTDRQVVVGSAVACGVAMFGGAAVLLALGSASFSANGVLGAMMRCMGAFANCPLYIGGRPPVPGDWQVQLILLPLAVFGGLGLPVLLDLWDFARRRRTELAFHTRVVLGMSAGLYLAGLLLFLVLTPKGIGAGFDAWDTIAAASAHSLSTRTAGFQFTFATAWPQVLRWVVVLLMVVGGSPAGTAGGLKTTTLYALFRGTRLALRGEAPGRPFAIALTWVGTYLGIVLACFLLFVLAVEEVAPDRALFETVSAVSNVGLSYDTILVVRGGIFILSGAMIFGRVVPLLMLWWMATTTADADVAVS